VRENRTRVKEPSGGQRSRKPAVIHAAGFVLFRRGKKGAEYLLLRNRKHGTWGFPKGVSEAGESEEGAARRELEEETGITKIEVVPGFRESISYRLPASSGGALKKVTYFLAEAAPKSVALSSEHDDRRFVDVDEARLLLAHQNLRRVLLSADRLVQGLS
jgi:8-oxo-dGTP pyrophosphatase MutT (NUDIX family)